MMTKGAVIGFPIQLMTRIISGGFSLGSALGGPVGGLLATAGVAFGVAATVVPAIVPHFNDMVSNDANRDANDLGVAVKAAIRSLITFVDMTAKVLDVTEERRLAVIDVPGREGDYIQNLGGKSARYRISGTFFRTDPKEGTPQSPFSTIFKAMFDNVAVGQVNLLTMLARTGVPVPFICEYGMAEVIISKFLWSVVAGNPETVNYTIDMIEYRRLPSLLKMVGLAALGVVDK